MRVFIDDPEKRSQSVPPLVCEELQRLRPRQASKFASVVLAGTSEGLAGLRVLKGARCTCCDTK